LLRLFTARLSAGTPSELRRLVLRLYLLFGAAFGSSLCVLGNVRDDPRPLFVAIAIMAGSALWLLLRPEPKVYDWIVPVAVSPTVCCGIGFWSCGDRGLAYLAVIGASVAWAAVLFEGPVVLAALAAATATVFVALSSRLGLWAAAGSTLILSPLAGLVALVVHSTAQHLREARRQIERLRAHDRALLEAIPDTLARVDRSGRMLELRLPPGETHGPQEVAGRSVAGGLPPEVARRMQEALDRALATDAVQTIDYAVPEEGRARHFEARFARSGRDEAIIIRRDITERTRAEEAHRESEERFRAVFETSPDAILVTRLADGLTVLVNEGFARMTGWGAAEAVGRSSLDLQLWDRPADRAELVARLEEAGCVENLEARLRRKDASVLLGLVSARRIDLGGQECILSITRDISEWKRAEEERDRLRSSLEQAARMEAIGQLAGGVAHDFNNLLTVILAGADAMRQDLSEGSSPKLEVVEEIADAGARARDLTSQLLAFARKRVIAPRPLDLNGLLGNLQKLLRRVIGEDVELLVTLQPDLWSVHCDPGQLEQVILNLAVNASDAMPTGGKLEFEARNVEVDGALIAKQPFMHAGPYVRLSIRDNGQGMSPEVKARVFEPFFTTKPIGKGTGLGLATVYGIVKQADGYILVESEPGKGATFTVYLPRSARSAVAQEKPVREESARGTENVLVVEDDPQVRNVTVRSLRAGGYRVLVAGDGREALDLGSRTEEPLHLLVTDVVMPGLNGRAVAEALRRRHPGLRVLYVSGYAQEAIATRGVLEPGIELLPKPFSPDALLARARSVLDGRA